MKRKIRGEVVNVGIYEEDNPQAMRDDFLYIQTEGGQVLLNGGLPSGVPGGIPGGGMSYNNMGRLAMKELGPKGLALVVLHPGKTHDPNNPYKPMTRSEILGYIARGMASAKGYRGRVEISDIEINLPKRGAKNPARK